MCILGNCIYYLYTYTVFGGKYYNELSVFCHYAFFWLRQKFCGVFTIKKPHIHKTKHDHIQTQL
jgi:hypothetical protein